MPLTERFTWGDIQTETLSDLVKGRQLSSWHSNKKQLLDSVHTEFKEIFPEFKGDLRKRIERILEGNPKKSSTVRTLWTEERLKVLVDLGVDCKEVENRRQFTTRDVQKKVKKVVFPKLCMNWQFEDLNLIQQFLLQQ